MNPFWQDWESLKILRLLFFPYFIFFPPAVYKKIIIVFPSGGHTQQRNKQKKNQKKKQKVKQKVNLAETETRNSGPGQNQQQKPRKTEPETVTVSVLGVDPRRYSSIFKIPYII
jgi:hypothetical protein